MSFCYLSVRMAIAGRKCKSLVKQWHEKRREIPSLLAGIAMDDKPFLEMVGDHGVREQVMGGIVVLLVLILGIEMCIRDSVSAGVSKFLNADQRFPRPAPPLPTTVWLKPSIS